MPTVPPSWAYLLFSQSTGKKNNPQLEQRLIVNMIWTINIISTCAAASAEMQLLQIRQRALLSPGNVPTRTCSVSCSVAYSYVVFWYENRHRRTVASHSRGDCAHVH